MTIVPGFSLVLYSTVVRRNLGSGAAYITVPAQPARQGVLSSRELDVLRLVALGKTNREIADELVISERTVINHLSHIFAKTGAENRAGAAAYAIRHNLV